jgi:NTP pyrophosphatase (non-canonical NTP hydrolase)
MTRPRENTAAKYLDKIENPTEPIEQTFAAIRKWAEARNFPAGSTASAQVQTLAEEMLELSVAIAQDKQVDVEDAIGDCVVVLTIIAMLRNVSIETCVRNAYAEIKDRKGMMIAGKFVKQADLDHDRLLAQEKAR